MKTKLTKNEVFKSVLTFIIAYIVLLLFMLLMITINLININGEHNITVAEFIVENTRSVITVCVSTALLMIINYVYFFFENKIGRAHV